ncbi:MAG: CBS domain-containing protein [Alphaproteobacteria bacterium]|jgi:CBS domain-containing protein|nr:CBS domain-containing protein [Alphaproteobacteria bacterium]
MTAKTKRATRTKLGTSKPKTRKLASNAKSYRSSSTQAKKSGNTVKRIGGTTKRASTSSKTIKRTVKDFMHKGILLMKPTDSVQNAAQKMNEKNNGCVFINENERISGVVTARDIVTRGVSKGKNLEALRLKDIMSAKILYCFEGDSLEQAAKSMAKNHIHRLPVLNKSKKLVGLLSLGNIALHSGSKAKKTVKTTKTTKAVSKKRK